MAHFFEELCVVSVEVLEEDNIDELLVYLLLFDWIFFLLRQLFLLLEFLFNLMGITEN